MDAPFPPLIAGEAALQRAPGAADALRKRMAAVYGVADECVQPVAGAARAVDMARRLDPTAVVVATPSRDGDAPVQNQSFVSSALEVIDESLIEFSEGASQAELASRTPGLVVIRSLEMAYGLAGAPCGAIIATPDLIAVFAELSEPLPTPTVRLATAVLDPSRTRATERRIAEVKAERARLALALNASLAVGNAVAAEGPFVVVMPSDVDAARAELRRLNIAGEWRGDGAFRLDVRDADANNRALEAFGIDQPGDARRRGEVVRETLETRIVVEVDLDAGPKAEIETGVGYYDHMLQQVATHGGFSLALTCAGDLEVDAHHTIEDCALALGEALKQALGAKRGIARFGFVLPMDEAEAKVSVDLGGRPYLVFEGDFEAPLIGEYPTEMTEHVFRSLSQAMGASIHVSVTGENDHHKTEACFKAFGRALRQAVRIEGEAIASTKGSI